MRWEIKSTLSLFQGICHKNQLIGEGRGDFEQTDGKWTRNSEDEVNAEHELGARILTV